MHRTLVILAMLALGLATTAALVAQSPPSYPETSSVTLEPVGASEWRAAEPEWDCPDPAPRRPFYGGAEVAPDGTLWFIDHGGIRQLGACPILEPAGSFSGRGHAFGPDGTLWVVDGDRLMRWNGEDWIIEAEDRFNQPGCTAIGIGPATPWETNVHGGECYSDCDLAPCVTAVDVAPDGTVWLSGTVLSAFDGEAWTDYVDDRAGVFVLGFDADGAVWVHRPSEGIYLIRPD